MTVPEAFKLQSVPVYEIGYRDWDEFVQSHYPSLAERDYEFVAWEEMGNDSQAVYKASGRKLDDYELKSIANADNYITSYLFDDLVHRGILPPASYIVKVCW